MVNTIDKGIGIPDQLHGSSFHGMLNKIFFSGFLSIRIASLVHLLGHRSLNQRKMPAFVSRFCSCCYEAAIGCHSHVVEASLFDSFLKGFQVGSIVEIKIKSCILVAEFVLS